MTVTCSPKTLRMTDDVKALLMLQFIETKDSVVIALNKENPEIEEETKIRNWGKEEFP